MESTEARWNLQMMEKYPNWYDHLDKVEEAIKEQDRIIDVRLAAGWELDEGGWMAPDTNGSITGCFLQRRHAILRQRVHPELHHGAVPSASEKHSGHLRHSPILIRLVE
jgi:hypothetical protein